MSSTSMASTIAEKNASAIGVGLRHPHITEALLGTSAIDFVELNAEPLLQQGGIIAKQLEGIASLYPISLHSSSLGLGSGVGVNQEYLQRLKQLSQQINPILLSDHACFTWSNINGNTVHAGDLLPLEYTQQSLEVMIDNVDRVQQTLGRQILVENLSAYVEFNFSDMSETEFLSELVDKTQCGLLVDLNNILVNARNFSQRKPIVAARQWLKEIPLKAIQEIHLAGFSKVKEGELVRDDHSSPVSPECWGLYKEVLKKIGPVTTLIEWDRNLPSWTELLSQAEKAHVINNDIFAKSAELSHAS